MGRLRDARFSVKGILSANRLNNDAHFVGLTTSDNRIRVGVCKPQLVAIKNAHLNGIATSRIDALRVVSQLKGNRHLTACRLNRLFRNPNVVLIATSTPLGLGYRNALRLE